MFTKTEIAVRIHISCPGKVGKVNDSITVNIIEHTFPYIYTEHHDSLIAAVVVKVEMHTLDERNIFRRIYRLRRQSLIIYA